MTTIYMIRSAECEDLQDASSEISSIGRKEMAAIETFFEEKSMDAVYVSTQKNAAETVKFMTIKMIERWRFMIWKNFREMIRMKYFLEVHCLSWKSRIQVRILIKR